MRIIRFEHEGSIRYGRDLGDGQAVLLDQAPWAGGRETGTRVAVDAVSLLAPVEPSKIVCIGKNYRRHVEEMGGAVPPAPTLFLKPPSALLRPGGTIELPPDSARVEHEGELGVVIGRPARRVREDDAREAIFGLTCVNDVTARDLQKSDVQFTRAKSFDTFCPTGPAIVTGLAPDALDLEVRVNGEVRQCGNTRDMLWAVPFLIAYVSRVMTLLPGDLLLTGTPEGVGPLVAGDRCEVEIEGVGLLANAVGMRSIPPPPPPGP